MDHRIEISTDKRVEYEFRTTGDINPINAEGQERNAERQVRGQVWGGKDVFEYNGAIMNFVTHEGDRYDLTIRVDGKPTQIPHLKMHVAVVKPLTDEATSYGLSSSGKMIKRGKSEWHDFRVDDNEFEGYSVGGEDKFAFQGTFTGFWCDYDCEVTIDGVTKTVKGSEPGGSW